MAGTQKAHSVVACEARNLHSQVTAARHNTPACPIPHGVHNSCQRSGHMQIGAALSHAPMQHGAEGVHNAPGTKPQVIEKGAPASVDGVHSLQRHRIRYGQAASP